MASALDILPDYVRADVMAGKARREDLAAIPDAEARGWRVTFRLDHWHNSAQFERGRVHVWNAATGGTYSRLLWRAADLVEGRYTAHRWHYGTLAEALASEFCE